MASRDISVVLYGGKVKIDYKDSSHQYWGRMRESWELPETDPKAWGKTFRPGGTTTILGDTLEKKGLLTWPMGLALRELFGFYDFVNERGEKMVGFSRDTGVLWDMHGLLRPGMNQGEALPFITSAARAYQRKQKKGADIGGVVHDAIEAYVNGRNFSIDGAYVRLVQTAEYDSEVERQRAMIDCPAEVAMANKAMDRFVAWWEEQAPELVVSEGLVYSLKYNYAGLYDAKLRLAGKKIRGDWKTSNASQSTAAAAPDGVYYSFFIQLGMYEGAAQEMGEEPSDDLLVLSVRKDGGFKAIFASELGLSVQDCVDWGRDVIRAHGRMVKAKKALIERGKEASSVSNTP